MSAGEGIEECAACGGRVLFLGGRWGRKRFVEWFVWLGLMTNW